MLYIAVSQRASSLSGQALSMGHLFLLRKLGSRQVSCDGIVPHDSTVIALSNRLRLRLADVKGFRGFARNVDTQRAICQLLHIANVVA